MKLYTQRATLGRQKANAVATLLACSALAAVINPLSALAQSGVDCSDPQAQQTNACQQSGSSQQYPNQYSQNPSSQNLVPSNALPASQSTASRDVYTDSGGFPTDRQSKLQNVNRQAQAPELPTDFQRLARSATGQLLPIFGRELFRMPPSTFAPADQIPVTPDYVIGPGDQILIRMWGHDNFNGRLTVDRSGEIYIPQVGSVHVAGEHFNELENQIHQEMTRTYRNFQLSVDMGQLRSIQVFVLGEAQHPGVYTVSALSTAFNALLISGGPTPQGSLRKIEVRRGGKAIATIDLYAFILRGDKSKDIVLQSDDVLFIPAVGAEAAVSGSIRHPAIYELNDETTLDNLLSLAGGLSSTASDQHVSIDRIEDHLERQALTFSMNAAGLATKLNDGDVVQIGSVLGSYKNSVTIRGNLANAGRFPWREGMKLSDIIPDRASLLTNDYWLKRNRLGVPTPLFMPLQGAENRNENDYDYDARNPQRRTNSGNGSGYGNGSGTGYDAENNSRELQQQGRDTQSQEYRGSSATSDGNGAAAYDAQQQMSGQNDRFSDRTTIQNSDRESNFGSLSQQQISANNNLSNAGRKNRIEVPTPEIDWSYAVIERLDPLTLKTSLIPFNLGRLVNDHDAIQDLALQSGDIVTILSQSDIHVAQAQQTKYIRLEGEFASAGVYSVGPNETLADVVRRAGGFTPNAYLFGSSFTRESARVMQQQRLDEYVTSLSIQMERSSAQRTISATSAVLPTSDVTGERDIVRQLKAMRATGRIVLEFKPASSGEASIPAIPLENGDTFDVPSLPIMVSVVGAVNGQNVFLYGPHRRVSDYLTLAGGPRNIADSKHEFIIRADGSVISKEKSGGLWSDHFESNTVDPGDTIVVPEKPIKPSSLRDFIDWSQVFSQFALGVTAIDVIR